MTGSWASCPSFSQVKALTRYFSEIFICSSSRSARGNLPVTGNAKKARVIETNRFKCRTFLCPVLLRGLQERLPQPRPVHRFFKDAIRAEGAPVLTNFFPKCWACGTTVSLAANTLQNAGVIHYRRGKISIANRKDLQSVSCDCYRTVKQNIAAIIVPEKSASTSSLRRGRVFGRISGRLS